MSEEFKLNIHNSLLNDKHLSEKNLNWIINNPVLSPSQKEKLWKKELNNIALINAAIGLNDFYLQTNPNQMAQNTNNQGQSHAE